MSLQNLLTDLSGLGIKLQLLGNDQLSINAPKGRLSDELMVRLRHNKTGLIELLAQKREAVSPSALPVIVPDPAHLYEPFPAADLQTAFLMGDGEDMEFHVRPHYYLEQDFATLDPQRYADALNAAQYRQRANLVLVGEDLRLQTLSAYTPVQVPVQDLRGLPPAEAQAALATTRAAMSRQTLPLDRWPWFDCRISLYADAQGAHKARLHYNNNNVFSDGFGSQKLMADVMHYYHHPEQPLPELTLSFRDCVLALADLETSPLGLASQRYWMARLPHLPGPPPLPFTAGANPRSRSHLQRRERVLPAALWSSFKEQARASGLTPNNALYAVYAELMACWSGTRHFLLNNMVTHRFPLHPEMNEIIGNFASLYPLEVDWRDGGSFAERARRLQGQIVSDLQHVYWSGFKVLQALNQVQKTPGRAPCPFVIGSGLFMKPYAQPQVACLETPQTVLDHQFWELQDGSLWFVWDLIERFFPDSMIDAMWDAYLALLTRLASDAQAWSAMAFDLLPAVQRQQRMALNQTAAAVPAGLLHASLARQALVHPHKLALVTAERSMSYAELNQHAELLAQRLLRAGVQRGELVAVMLDKGWAQAVAVFGALKAGVAYVPIDGEWPQERIHTLLGNIAARLVLTRRGLAALSTLPQGVQAVLVDDLDAGNDAPALPAIEQAAQDLAYIIFTSGSTGMPKGVMIDHRGALNTVLDINQRFGVTADDVVYGISSLYFDLSVYDLFGSAAAGATLVLPDADGATDPQAWIAAILAQQVSVWNSVPALMQLLVDAALAANIRLPSLRSVLLSGDWIPVKLPQQIRQVAPNARVISLGGATEASIWSIYYPVDEHALERASIPYGRPLANQQWHVLDAQGNDAPIWVPGHLHIGGTGLAQGYWQDQQKTAAAFSAHPGSGERLYRTGDLGRYLPDGNIEFLGRSDFQVKIQGFRVELGEIEQALLTHPAIRAATVLVGETAAGKQLLAFFVAHGAATVPTAAQVKDYLRGKLPRYMVPSQITALEQLPLTANGKVNRQALLKLSDSAGPQASAYVAASSPVEQELVAIWEEVLVQRPIGIHDDFFEMGGQSFAAVRVMTRIARQFGRRLPLSDLLEGRNIAHLAQRLQQERAWSPLVPIVTAGALPACFFIHPAGGNVLCYRDLAARLGRPFYALQAAGLSGEQAPLASIEAMAALYVQAIRQVQPRGPYLLGGWSSGGVIAFAMARQIEQEGDSVARVLMLDTPAPLQHEAVDAAAMLQWFLEDLDLGADVGHLDCRALLNEHGSQALEHALILLKQSHSGAADLDPLHIAPVYAVFRHIIDACRGYRPAPIAAPISVLRAQAGRVSEFIGHPADATPDWGWSAFSQRPVSCAVLPGSHYSMLAPVHGALLAAAIEQQFTGATAA